MAWEELERNPEWGYASWLKSAGQDVAPTFWESMQRQYNNYWSKYLGEIGRTIQEGNIPTLQWTDYLAGLQPPRREWGNLSSYNRGVQSVAPMFRFIGGGW